MGDWLTLRPARTSTRGSCLCAASMVFCLFLSLSFASLCGSVESARLASQEAQVLRDMLQIFPILHQAPYSWNNDTQNACDKMWLGVQCDNQDPAHITDMNITTGNVTGFLPDSIGNLTQIQNIAFSANFVRAFPSSIGSLPNLQHLILIGAYNPPRHLTIPIPFPTFLGSLSRTLTNLVLQYIEFSNGNTASLSSISGLTNLNTLSLVSTNLGGSFPPIMNLTQLTTLDLGYNKFEGPIPTSIDKLYQLKNLFIGNNRFNESLPAQLGNLTSLRSIIGNTNQFSGDFPAEMNKLTNLKYVSLGTNNFSGNVYDAFGRLPNLLYCYVLYNPLLICPRNFSICCGGTSTSPTTTAVSTSGTTACTGFTCMCASDLSAIITTPAICNNGTWIINETATNNGTVVVAQGDTIIVGGPLSQAEQGVLEVYVNKSGAGNFIVQGPATLGGTLVIVTTSAADRTSVNIINATSISGNFSVQVAQKYEGSSCYKTQASPVYTSSSMSVLLTTTQKFYCKKLYIGIIIGLVILAVILILIATFVTFFFPLSSPSIPDHLLITSSSLIPQNEGWCRLLLQISNTNPQKSK